MSQNTFSMVGGVARNPLVRLAKPVTATIGADEHIAIVNIRCVKERCNMIFLLLLLRPFMIM